jgi:hypothetical protein
MPQMATVGIEAFSNDFGLRARLESYNVTDAKWSKK